MVNHWSPKPGLQVRLLPPLLNMSLVDQLINTGWLKTERIVRAFRKIDRGNFLPEDERHLAGLNEALPIGYGQTISQPLVVAFMLELLEPKQGDKILDIGSGSGWTTALLAQIVGEKGKVIAIEVIFQLVEFGKENISRYNFIKKGIVEIIYADGKEGCEKEAPFDKILVSASAHRLCPALKKQLKEDGRIVMPIENSIWLFKKKEYKLTKKEFKGFSFVPLV